MSATMSSPTQRRKIRRNGRIASLTRVYRDMVNRMLGNAVPYKNIVAALHDQGYKVTQRNVSNWATGGYLEWRLEQEAVLQNRLDQDHQFPAPGKIEHAQQRVPTGYRGIGKTSPSTLTLNSVGLRPSWKECKI